MNITELEEWCVSQREIESVETELAYYPLGMMDEFRPMTQLRTTILLVDGKEWHNLAGRLGRDYRTDEGAMDAICQTSEMVIQRFLDSRGTTNAEEDT